MGLLHSNGLRLGLLLLHLVMLLSLLLRCLRLYHSCGLLWAALLLILHLLLLLLEEVRGKVDKALLSHLLPHCRHLLRAHVWHLVWETHAHAALLLGKHRLLLLLAHKGLLLGVSVLLEHCRGHYLRVSRVIVWRFGALTHCRMLLLLRKHVRLLGLQMRKRVCVGSSHAWLHAHHGPRLANRPIGT
jgi:hypothetical protein